MPRRKQSKHPPTRHTMIISDVHAMWEKMWWDVDQFGDIQRSYPDEEQPLIYAALNACVSAWSLEQWAKRAWKQNQRAGKEALRDKDFSDILRNMVPLQGICADVANTTKHMGFDDNRSAGSALEFSWDDGDEDCPPGMTLSLKTKTKTTIFYNEMCDLPKLWWYFLLEMKLVKGASPTPKWWQNSISRQFPNIGQLFLPPQSKN